MTTRNPKMIETRQMVRIPRTRLTMGLTAQQADRLAREISELEKTAHEPGLRGFDVFDLEAAVHRRRTRLELACPAHEVEVGPFEIDMFPVTHAQWQWFMVDTGAVASDSFNPHFPDQFITGISWRQAQAYAHWQGVTLPTEAEWECAARGPEGFLTLGEPYLLESHAGLYLGRHTPYRVPPHPETASPWGVHHLLGPFGEYCADFFEPYPGADRGVRESLPGASKTMRVMRGGSDFYQGTTCVARWGVPEDEPRSHIKFRCVRRPG